MNPRKSIDELKLTGSQNLRRSLAYGNGKRLAKAEDLETLFGELKQRRADLLREVKRDGIVIQIEKVTARGAIYHATITNPAYSALRATESQLVSLARLIGSQPEPEQTKEPNPLDSFDQFINNNDDEEERLPS